MKATPKRQAKSDEGKILGRATNNLLKALKQDMVRKNGSVNSEKLRKEGYSERLISKLEQS
jgi:hypothetical protein